MTLSRNGSGVYSLSDTIAPSDPQSSTVLMGILNDIKDALTASVAADGQTTMTGPLKAADGSITAPGVAFGSDTNTGFYRSASGVIRASLDGTNSFTLTASGLTVPALTIGSDPVTAFPAGTAVLFAQTAAPTGWTKSTTHDNKALRVVSGTASSGGTVAFTTAFASQAVAGTVGGTAITQANLPAINLTVPFYYSTSVGGGGTRSGYGRQNNFGEYTNLENINTSTLGSGTAHTHTFTGTAMDLAVQYVDVIIATKD